MESMKAACEAWNDDGPVSSQRGLPFYWVEGEHRQTGVRAPLMAAVPQAAATEGAASSVAVARGGVTRAGGERTRTARAGAITATSGGKMPTKEAQFHIKNCIFSKTTTISP